MSVTTESPGTPAPASSKPGGGQPHRVGGGLLDPKILWKSTAGRVQEAGPPGADQEPGHVRGRGRLRTDPVHGDQVAIGVQLDHRGLAVADRRVRQPGRGGGRGPRQGAGRDAAPGQARDDGAAADQLAARDGSVSAARGVRGWHGAAARRLRGGRGGPGHPRRRGRGRGRGLGGRVGHHRRVRPGHPRVGRRPVRGHRRHHRAVRPDRRQDHLQARRDLHRPDDRPGRGGQAAEDAERDRAEHPARLADHHLHARGHHAAADGVLLQRAADTGDPGRAAGGADPDHDRRAAVRDRHRRHGPAGAAQRAGRVRPRGRGGRRRQHAAAGQDRHDHHRQPAGQRVPAGRRGDRRRGRQRGAAVVDGGLHPGGPLDRGAGQEPVRPA